MLLWRAKHYFPWQFLKIRCHIRDFGCKAVSLTWKMFTCFAKHVNLVEFLRYSIQALRLFLKSKLCMVFRNMNSCKRSSWSSRPVSIGIMYFLHVFILLKSCGLLVFCGFVCFCLVWLVVWSVWLVFGGWFGFGLSSSSAGYFMREILNPSLMIGRCTLLISRSSMFT